MNAHPQTITQPSVTPIQDLQNASTEPSTEPSTKRLRASPPEKEEEDFLFRVKVTQPTSLRALAENISHVIKTVEFHVVCEEDFQGLRVETLDDLKVCLVLGQLPCDVEVSERWKANHTGSICLSVEYLLLFLRQVDMQYSVELTQIVGQENIVTLRSSETLSGEDELKVDLHALVSEGGGTIRLKEFPVDWQIEMELHSVRSFLKMCDQIKAEDVEIIVKRFNTDQGPVDAVTMKASEMQSMVDLQRTYRSIRSSVDNPDEGDDTSPPPPIQTMGEGELIFQEAFSCKYLNNFLRSMNRTTVVLQMAPAKPLHVVLPLGGRGSSVTFILAPKNV